MATIYIDNQPYETPSEGKNLLEACLSLGFNIPYFCWHPAVRSVGACRQCAVKQFRDESDTQGRLVMACMTPASDGVRISIDDPQAVDFRRRMLEWLMINHPHDCPVCDEGGECHLQDMTVMTGHAYRRYRFRKRTHRNQDLGPFVNHEMNRCIQCYRCVRFYRDFAGGRDLEAMGCHDDVYFGRHQDGVLQSVFSGNLVEVCPTGVFTDKTLKRHYTRKWDLQTAPSICVHCGLGCNTIPGERYGVLRRIQARYSREVNGYFLCDRGRFGYEFVNSGRRIRRPVLREGGAARELDAAEAVRLAGDWLREGRAIGIGSPRASMESNFALRTLVGEGNFFQGAAPGQTQLVGEMLEILRKGPAASASLLDASTADAALVLGEDPASTAPMLALALRQAVLEKPAAEVEARLKIPRWDDAMLRLAMQEQRGPLFLATTDETKIDDVATATYRAAPDELARLGLAVARAIDGAAQAPGDLSQGVADLAGRIAAALKAAQRPLVVCGASCGSLAVIRAAANVAWALRRAGLPAKICFVAPECNSMGLALLGRGDLDAALDAVRAGGVDTLVVLEADLHRHLAKSQADELLAGVRRVIVLDHLAGPAAERADLLLPAATFAESSGTYVNNEVRAQRFYQVFVLAGDVRAGWVWLGDILAASQHRARSPWGELDEIVAALCAEEPALASIADIAPPAGFRMTGQKVPRQPHRYSGRTAMHANVSVEEPATPADADSALAYSMEGAPGEPPAALIPRYWAPGWNSVQAINKFQIEVGGPLHGGESGRRLIEPAAQEAPYFSDAPAAFVLRVGEWLVVPAHHVFGSEPLSMHSPGVAELAARPYVALGAADAARLPAKEGDVVLLTLGAAEHRLPLRIRRHLPAGLAALPAGLADLPALALPAWGRIALAGGGPRKEARE